MLLRLCVFTLGIIGAACSVQSQPVNAQESKSVTVHLTSEAIETAVLSEGVIWLKLTLSGSNQLAAAAKDNPGSKVTIHVLGHEAVSLMVVHELVSERLVINTPSPELKAAIEPYLVGSE